MARRPVLRVPEPAVQVHAVGRGDAHFLDAAGVRHGPGVFLVERARAEDKLRLERLEERRDASGGDGAAGADHQCD